MTVALRDTPPAAFRAAAAPLNSNAIDVEKTRRRIEDRLRKDPTAVVEVAKLLFGGCAMEF